jgi:hypothetical protein
MTDPARPPISGDLGALAEAIRARRAILFAGAGLSMSVGLPSWRELIEHMCQELGLEGADLREASYQTLAEYYRLRTGSIGALRSWMDRRWSVSEEAVRGSRVHELIVELDFPIVYTTNYDANLEVAYRIHGRPFVKIANARDLASAPPDITQIVKYHGDFEDDASLVIAETDYFERLKFASPLDIKFRADALARTLLFVGYSMSDLNIRLLLHSLWQTWEQSGDAERRPPSYVFMPRPDPVQEAVLGRWGVTVLTGDADDPGEALTRFLSQLTAAVTAG